MFSSDHHESFRRHSCNCLHFSCSLSPPLLLDCVNFLRFLYRCVVRVSLLKLRHVLPKKHSHSRIVLCLTLAPLRNYLYNTQRIVLTILQSNQRESFHLHIPDVHLLVVVLRNVQAPAEITKTLIIMTLQFSATLHYSLANV